MTDVTVVSCPAYEEVHLARALREALAPFGFPEAIKENMHVVIKANLVAPMRPDTAATIHPELLRVLCDMITERGAHVTIGDSAGGLFNAAYMHGVYRACGLTALESETVKLNNNFAVREVSFPEAHTAKTFSFTAYLDDADYTINVCKLKSHGMMTYSASVKNLFGVIPGTMKPEYHFRYPKAEDFANMLLDLNEYVKADLCICDAVLAMEGNGPTAGKPRMVGAIIASDSPYKLDLVGAHVVSLTEEEVATIVEAKKRGLSPESYDALTISGDMADLQVEDFEHADGHRGLQFETNSVFGKLMSKAMGTVLTAKPKLYPDECIGCKKCAQICPAKAITMKNGKPVIDRKACIRCFCCQEFCPKGAMRVGRNPIAKILTRTSK